MKKICYWHLANKIGLFLAIMLVICFVWYYVHPVEQDLHLRQFKMAFWGFSGMDAVSIVLALIQAYIFGYVVAGVCKLVCLCCCKGGCCEK